MARPPAPLLAGWNGGWRPCHGYCPAAANHSGIVPVQPRCVKFSYICPEPVLVHNQSSFLPSPARMFACSAIVPLPATSSSLGAGSVVNGSTLYLMIGDRWQSARSNTDRTNGKKSDDFTTWLPILFDEATGQLRDNVWHDGTAADDWSFELRL